MAFVCERVGGGENGQGRADLLRDHFWCGVCAGHDPGIPGGAASWVRTAELIEEPIMFMVVLLAARWLVRRFTLELLRERLGAGTIGLGLLLTAEYALLRAQGLTLREDIARRDAVAGIVYLVMLLVFAVMPAVVGRRRPGT
jgi:hypothetical protein